MTTRIRCCVPLGVSNGCAFLKRFMVLFLFHLIFLNASPAEAVSPASFQQAKKVAADMFAAQRETLYCACRFDSEKAVDLDSCHMQAAAIRSRALRIEWEHMMPASHFGKQFACWTKPLCEKNGKAYKGRKCCTKIDKQFRRVESELYNLWPAVGVINQIRSNYHYSKLSGEQTLYGCAFKVDKDKRQVEPPDFAKGIVARASLFMSYFYNVPLAEEQRQLFEYWHALYPAGAWEKQWAAKVAAIEGYDNPYIQ